MGKKQRRKKMKEMKEVSNLPKNVVIKYSIEAVIKWAKFDGKPLTVKNGNTVVLPWKKEYQPKADFLAGKIFDFLFYIENSWIKTEKSWVYASIDNTIEYVNGGILEKSWEIESIVLPPFPEIQPLQKTVWNNWKIRGDIWNKKEVSFSWNQWTLWLPIFFRDIETLEELEFLKRNKILFVSSGEERDCYDYFFTRISYLAKRFGVHDPGIEIKKQRSEVSKEASEAEKMGKKEETKRKADLEIVEVPYYFQELNYFKKPVEFKVKGRKVFRLYGKYKVLLRGTKPFSKKILVKMTRKKLGRLEIDRKNIIRVDLPNNYFAVYASN